MKKFLTQGRLAALVVAGVLIIDQLIKISVKTNMFLHENIHVTDWFYIYFTENNGMAFGLEIFAKLSDAVPHCGGRVDYGVHYQAGETDHGQSEERLPGVSFPDSGRSGGQHHRLCVLWRDFQ